MGVPNVSTKCGFRERHLDDDRVPSCIRQSPQMATVEDTRTYGHLGQHCPLILKSDDAMSRDRGKVTLATFVDQGSLSLFGRSAWVNLAGTAVKDGNRHDELVVSAPVSQPLDGVSLAATMGRIRKGHP